MYAYAVAYRACHLFTAMGGAANSGGVSMVAGLGQIASMSEGGMSVSFATSAGSGEMSNSALDTTKYGKALYALIKSRPTMGVNVAGAGFE
jgi:hypothetical protein